MFFAHSLTGGRVELDADPKPLGEVRLADERDHSRGVTRSNLDAFTDANPRL